MQIALFVACYNDTLFPQTGIAVTNVLERLGHTVTFPMQQTCCGQMHYNTGFHREAVPIVRRFVQTFADSEVVCVPSSSCVAMMREHYEMIAESENDPAFLADVRALLPRIFELSELLVDRLGIENVGASFPHSVAYHPSCHSVRVLHLGDKPTRLLRAVKGLSLIDIPNKDQCCGFGGTFAVKNADVSGAMLAEKQASILSTGAEVVTAVDNSCLMHIYGGLHRAGSKIRTLHMAEILASQESAR
ncbi:MAG: (Fe-S)-binding protein [Acidobacteriaceae bacterium]|nr:(Fe-S)-binding protein [Acidobacteriaceae bacterium]